MFWCFVGLALLGGGSFNAWWLMTSLDRGFRYRSGASGVETNKTVELSNELEREGVKITSFGFGCEIEGYNFLRKERRRVFLTIEPAPEPSAAELRYTLYGTGNASLSSGMLCPVTNVDDLTRREELIVDNDRAIKTGSGAECVKRATHLIIDEKLTIATRVVVHR